MEGVRAGAFQWQLPLALQLHILSLLPPNDRALSGRLVSPDAAAGLTGPDHCTASLSQPLPPHAAPWAVAAGQQQWQHVRWHERAILYCRAAASGSEVNLAVAHTVLHPTGFVWLAKAPNYGYRLLMRDPGVAAVKAGHPQLLPWLLHHCPGLIFPPWVLSAAMRHRDLAGLRATWEALEGVLPDSSPPSCFQALVDTATVSDTPGSHSKLDWLLSVDEVKAWLRDLRVKQRQQRKPRKQKKQKEQGTEGGELV